MTVPDDASLAHGVAGEAAQRVEAARDVLSDSGTMVAPRLLGAHLTSDIDGAQVRIRLTEVEAYEGVRDPASHAYRGRTPRNAIMFGPAGHLYVYFVYGMHFCANVVCGPPDSATAVLLRGGRVEEGEQTARERRPAVRNDVDLARGPARLARCLGLTGAVNGIDLLQPGAPVRLTLAQRPVPAADIACGPRIGVSAAPAAPWRFWVSGDRTVSTYRAGGRRARRAAGQTERP